MLTTGYLRIVSGDALSEIACASVDSRHNLDGRACGLDLVPGATSGLLSQRWQAIGPVYAGTRCKWQSANAVPNCKRPGVGTGPSEC
jgi:hypothetical protein